MPPFTAKLTEVNAEQLNVADVGVTESGATVGGGRFLSAVQVPEPFEPVLVYGPERVFQLLLAVPVRVVVLKSELVIMIVILSPLKLPVNVAPSAVVPEKGSYLLSCLIKSCVERRAGTPGCIRTRFQVPSTSPCF